MDANQVRNARYEGLRKMVNKARDEASSALWAANRGIERARELNEGKCEAALLKFADAIAAARSALSEAGF